jgi:hypothetical protein
MVMRYTVRLSPGTRERGNAGTVGVASELDRAEYGSAASEPSEDRPMRSTTSTHTRHPEE